MAFTTLDQDLLDDLVGVASARLAAAGVPRANRVRAMRMLAILSTVADAELFVRQPVVDVAAEFDFPVDEARRAVDALEQVGVLHREGPSVRLSARETAVGGMRLIDFVELTESSGRRSPLRVALRPVVAASLAAVLLLTGAVVGNRLVRHSRARVLVAEGEPSANAATTDKRFPHGSVPDGAPAVDVPADAELPMKVSTTTTLLLATCPTGTVPSLGVDGSAVDADGGLSVEGTARNPAPAPVQISGFTVYVTLPNGQVQLTPVASPLTVPANGSVHWQTRVPVVAAAGTPATVALDRWTWADDALRQRCPTG